MGRRNRKASRGDLHGASNSHVQSKADELTTENSDDEEIPEDEAFNSDDERKYGSFFLKSQKSDESKDDEFSEDESDSDDSASDDEDSEIDGDEGEGMLDLLNNLEPNNRKNSSNGTSSSSIIACNIRESAFATSVVGNAGLTLDSLMEEIKDTKGFGSVQSSMRKIVDGKATSAPIAHVISEREKRKINYEKNSKEVSQWTDAVQRNRQSETLDFRPKARLSMTQDVMIDKFVPSTDFEKQIHAALEEAGQKDDEQIRSNEEAALHDDLGSNDLTIEEYKKRVSQLAKMRALMFYHEQKRHHIKKIKSKKYRRIRKAQREKQKSAELSGKIDEDPVLAREFEDKEEIERMKERMTLAHKNTSKWAKRVLKRGKNVDVDTRRALSAQLKRGDDLLKRMNATRDNESEDDGENLVGAARKALAETDCGSGTEEQESGLFKLAFMKKSAARQREIATQEARQLLLELQANEELDIDDEPSDKLALQEGKDRPLIPRASKKEMKDILEKGEIVTSALKFGQSRSISTDNNIDISVGFVPRTTEINEVSSDSTSMYTSTIGSSWRRQEVNTRVKGLSKEEENYVSTAPKENEENPWLLASDPSIPASTLKHTLAPEAKGSCKRSKNIRFVDVDLAIDLLACTPKAVDLKDKIQKLPEIPKQNITSLTQEELVHKAFATTSEQEADAEFALEKDNVENDDNPTRRIQERETLNNAVGWGSWTGAGAPPPGRQGDVALNSRPTHKNIAPKREDERRPDVIIRRKRIKKLADNFMISKIPYPYTSREEYERAMAGGLGREWNITSSFKDMTRPSIIARPGKIIQPISKRLKMTRGPAKF